MTHRSATLWHKTTDAKGRTIKYITSDEVGIAAVALCSVYNPASDEPSARILRLDPDSPFSALGFFGRDLLTDEDQPFPPTGLLIYGSAKHDRASLAEADIHDRDAAEAIRADIEARHAAHG